MPVISRFNGIVIRMYFLASEHNPPHLHAIYGDNVAAIDFQTDEVLDGYLPQKTLDLVLKWISLHREELIQIWKTQNFVKIPPL
ncbi:MAG: DUF4160 domain-containing protein [Pseudobutyrivibrio sp.]|nr:DUF4160 domain-containing protein [Pseudobutyrivibrio sp.]